MPKKKNEEKKVLLDRLQGKTIHSSVCHSYPAEKKTSTL